MSGTKRAREGPIDLTDDDDPEVKAKIRELIRIAETRYSKALHEFKNDGNEIRIQQASEFRRLLHVLDALFTSITSGSGQGVDIKQIIDVINSADGAVQGAGGFGSVGGDSSDFHGKEIVRLLDVIDQRPSASSKLEVIRNVLDHLNLMRSFSGRYSIESTETGIRLVLVMDQLTQVGGRALQTERELEELKAKQHALEDENRELRRVIAAREIECILCVTRSVNRVLPCGHTFCNECIDKFQADPLGIKNCPNCNDTFRNITVKRLFL